MDNGKDRYNGGQQRKALVRERSALLRTGGGKGKRRRQLSCFLLEEHQRWMKTEKTNHRGDNSSRLLRQARRSWSQITRPWLELRPKPRRSSSVANFSSPTLRLTYS